MTPRHNLPPEELLSACHDGELTPVERAEVDRLLAETPALRETLDDFRELTSVLQSLPRPQAPARLQEDVLRRVQASRPRQSAMRPSRRFPWLWGTSLAATAAVLLIVVQGAFRRSDPAVVATNSEAAKLGDGVSERQTAGMEAGEAEAMAMADSAVPALPASVSADAVRSGAGSSRNVVPVERPLPFPSLKPAASDGSAAPGSLALPSAAAEADGGMGGANMSAIGDVAAGLKIDHRSPPAVSEVLSHLVQSGEQTLIVEFDVVNVDQTSRDVLVLLRQRGITVVNAAADEAGLETPAGATAQSLKADGAQPLVAVYVEATEAQLAAVVDDFLGRVAISDSAAYNTDFVGPELELQLGRIEELYGSGVGAGRRMSSTPAVRGVIKNTAQPAPSVPPESSLAQTAPVETTDEPAADGAPHGQGVQLSIPSDAYRRLEVRNRNGGEGTPGNSDPAGRSGRFPERINPAAEEVPKPADAPPTDPAESDSPASPESYRQMLIVLRGPMPE